MRFTVTASHARRHAAAWPRGELRLKDFGNRCPVATPPAAVFTASCRPGAPLAACRRLASAPSHETVRQALLHNLPDLDTLERRLNHALTADLPRGLTRRRRRLASDLTLLPYHGQAAHDPHELVRGQAKSGTTHFHAYATAYVVLRGQRFTVAMTYVRQGEKAEKVLQRLLRRCAGVGVRPGLLLLDRGYWAVGVIRYLQAARYPFLMPVIARGRKAGHPKGPGGTRVFWNYRRGGWGEYTLQETGGGRKATVSICVHLRPRAGRRGKHGREHLVYAYRGWQPSSPRAVSERYRGRFGIETSYRQMNEARVTTCSRSPAVRLFLVGVASVPRNVWVWLHHEVLSTPRRGRRRYHPERLRFKDLLLMLLHAAELALGVCGQTITERTIPIEVGTTARPGVA